ncbi:AAA family ATPase [Nocardia sp. CC201C]|uniref:nucleotide-binding protein n=1 Tax=Nocardia sp. CC201C TaxID=3044575 RepID=UPI0024A8C587|nr:AAA family ATPase [Nocardia sp. CC201C]
MAKTPPPRRSLVARMRAAGGIVVACVSTKGGVGKSTLAYNLADEYADRGATVLLINTDIQRTVVDAYAMRETPARFEVLHYPHESLWRDFARLRAGHDVVVIDGQGRNDVITRAGVTAAAQDEHGVILIPVVASPPDVWATKRDMAPIITAARELAWALRVRTVLMRYDDKELITTAAREALAAAPVIAPPTQTDIPRRTIYTQAISEGLSVREYDPRGAAAREIAALATELATLALTDPEQKETPQ